MPVDYHLTAPEPLDALLGEVSRALRDYEADSAPSVVGCRIDVFAAPMDRDPLGFVWRGNGMESDRG